HLEDQVSDKSSRDLRSFLAEFEAAHPDEVLRIKDAIDLEFDATAIALELEKQGRSPILWFENVRGSRFPVVMNLYGRRSRFAFALGVDEGRLIDTWARSDASPVEPVVVDKGPV